MPKKIKKILVANRGEIAVRVMRTCRELGISTVAIYSQPDRSALHVRYANESYALGGVAPKDTYLRIEKLLAVAKESGADAVHPGYGFLSENAHFAEACEQADLIFIGPKSNSMRAMGSKTMARQLMDKAGVPVVPGLLEPSASEEETLRAALRMGFPVMLKAAMGGGGKGMRRVNSSEEFASAFVLAKSEAKNAFGDDSIYVEKFLEEPRHIEVQVFGDVHGRIVSFAERECSVQRRHQKVIEESPSAFVDANLRTKMGEVARKAAHAVDYVGAGTIEFLVDKHKNFYFMEMNTRLQVEHPVTEMVSGYDLVEWQIRVAEGEPLPLPKNETVVPHNGWAMEVRLCAEDPNNGFLPTGGYLREVRLPGGPFVRMDSGIFAGVKVTSDYDSMLAKVVVWASERLNAIARLDRALSETAIKGCTTNIAFLRQLLAYAPFVSGQFDTSMIERFFKEQQRSIPDEVKTVALIGAALFNYVEAKDATASMNETVSASARQSAWALKDWRQKIS
jgi:acetyl-CoA carboxylase biotin carboxylase subunit